MILKTGDNLAGVVCNTGGGAGKEEEDKGPEDERAGFCGGPLSKELIQ